MSACGGAKQEKRREEKRKEKIGFALELATRLHLRYARSQFATSFISNDMVKRSSAYPRLPSIYWGELIYATPGCGKTYVANKYRDVVDGDDLIVEAISQVKPYWDIGYYVQ